MLTKIIYKIKKIDKKISKIIDTILKKIDLTTLLSFTILFILIYFQNGVVSMYFDDFGNASLSYAYDTPNVIGTNYTFNQLIEWATNIYQGWGGRILYAIFAIIPLLKTGIEPYMFVQTFVIIGICYFFYKIIEEYSGKKYKCIPILFFILYSLIDMFYLRHGIYWASASVLYIWPLLPLFAFIYAYMRFNRLYKTSKISKIKYIMYIPILVALIFLTCFSQEQIGVALIAFLICYILFDHIKDLKKYLKMDLICLITAIASYLLLFLAPGNWARMDTNVEFAKLSFFEKISLNFPGIIKNIFVDPMNIFMYILTIILFYLIIKIGIESKSKLKKWLVLSMIPILLILFAVAIFIDIEVLSIIFGVVWLCFMFVTSIIYFYDKKQLSFCAIEVGAVASIFCLLMSPVIGGRTSLPFIFFIFLIIIYFVIQILNTKNGTIRIITMIIISVLAYKGLNNYITIYEGYRDNKEINNLNFEILKNYNYESDKISLYKVKNSWYGSTKSYEEPSMDYWIKEYFNIPQDITFEWVDIYDR